MLTTDTTGAQTINQQAKGKTPQQRVGQKPKNSALKLIRIPTSWQKKAWQSASLAESFRHAFRGFAIALRSERNMRVHLLAAMAVVIGGVLLGIEPIGWAMLSLAIGMVFTAELINTALERLVDLATEGEFHRLARDAKDVAAAAVLCTSLAAVLIGLFVFVPRFIAMAHIYHLN